RDFHVTGVQTCALPIYRRAVLDRDQQVADPRVLGPPQADLDPAQLAGGTVEVVEPGAVLGDGDGVVPPLGAPRLVPGAEDHQRPDRKSVVEGESVDDGG